MIENLEIYVLSVRYHALPRWQTLTAMNEPRVHDGLRHLYNSAGVGLGLRKAY